MGCSLSALFWTHNYFTSVTSLSPLPVLHCHTHTHTHTDPAHPSCLRRERLCVCVCVCVCLAVSRPHRWPFPCQDKHRCHTTTIAMHLCGNKPEPQPCGSVLVWWRVTFQLGTKIMFWQNVLQLAADAPRFAWEEVQEEFEQPGILLASHFDNKTDS